MIRRARQYLASGSDRSYLKVCYLILALAVAVLAISSVANHDAYRLRRAAPASDGKCAESPVANGSGSTDSSSLGGEESAGVYDGMPLLQGEAEDEDERWRYDRDALKQPGSPEDVHSDVFVGSLQTVGNAAPFGAEPLIVPAEADFFEELKMDRDRTRSREQEVIQGLIDDPNTAPDIRRRAQEALLSSADRARREAEAESMIEAKGYEQAVVFLSEAGASVVVKSGRLEEAGVKQIGDAVSMATGVELRRISIMEREP